MFQALLQLNAAVKAPADLAPVSWLKPRHVARLRPVHSYYLCEHEEQLQATMAFLMIGLLVRPYWGFPSQPDVQPRRKVHSG